MPARFSTQLRARLFGVIGTTLIVPIACGGQTDQTAGDPGDASLGGGAGTPATGGGSQGGGFAQGGSAQAGNAGMPPGSGGTSSSSKKCLDEQTLDAYCVTADGGYSEWTCWAEDGGTWAAGAGGCPHSLTAFCRSYTELQVTGDQCCYLYNPGGGGCGRPFLVSGRARSADVVERGDWLAETGVELHGLDGPMRQMLGSEWLADARLEHASVASFARFALELLALGAPARLLADVQRAVLDEIEHARLCFGLASGYLARAVGPAALPIDGCIAAPVLADVAARAAREGCIGETLAALVAAEQLARATVPAARAALGRIADDEAAHAELSWRFVAWAIARGGERVRRAVAAEMRRALDELRESPDLPATDGVDARVLNAHGRLSARARREAELRALDEVVEPCVRRLIGSPPAPAELADSC